MRTTPYHTPRWLRLGWIPCLALLGVAACEHATDPTNAANSAANPPSPGTSAPVFSATGTVTDLQNSVDSGVVRVRIKLVTDSLVARRVTIERASARRNFEELDGRVTALEEGTGADTLTLDIGTLKVVLDSTTMLRGEHEWGNEDGNDQPSSALMEFTSRLKMELAAGRRPFVEARRAEPGTPEAAGDSAAFVARTVRLDDADDAPEIEIDVDSANFATVASPPPAAWLTVLGQHIAITGSTVIKSDLPRAEGVQNFSDTVATVDTTARTATLTSGLVLRIVAGTEIETDDGQGLATLPDVAAALAQSKVVLAHGRGLLETATPATLDVIEVVFHLGT